MNGWTKDFRSTLEWEWFTDVPTAHLWEYMRLRANWNDETWRGVNVPRGSFITSDAKMEYETGLSRQQIRTAVKKLISTGNITKVSTKEYTLYTVVKYSEYQGEMDDINQEPTNSVTTVATSSVTSRATTNEEDKNIRREEDKNINAGSKPAEKPFIKPTIEQVISYCIENGYSEIDAQRFMDYYEKNNWTVKDRNGRRKMKNWKLCLNSWVVNEIRFNKTDDLRNKAREAFIKDVEMKQAKEKKPVERKEYTQPWLQT